MTATDLWLVRHPEPEASARGLCYGSLDVALSDAGRQQARAVAAALAAQPLAAIYTSPRRRCAEAARLVGAGRSCPLETMDALRELDFGAFEGRAYDEIAASDAEFYRQWMESPTEVHFPGGESFAEMRLRVCAAAAEVRARHAGQAIALVTHGGAIRILLAEALGMPPGNIFRIAQDYGAINLVRYYDTTPQVRLINGFFPDSNPG